MWKARILQFQCLLVPPWSLLLLLHTLSQVSSRECYHSYNSENHPVPPPVLLYVSTYVNWLIYGDKLDFWCSHSAIAQFLVFIITRCRNLSEVTRDRYVTFWDRYIIICVNSAGEQYNISWLSVLEAQDDSTEAEECSSFRLNYVRVARAGWRAR